MVGENENFIRLYESWNFPMIIVENEYGDGV
jgi:hypothetical protein